MASIRSGIGEDMEDRYLFKAKRVDDGEWMIGYLYGLSERHPPFIMLSDGYGESYGVDEHTICQCTGLKDKNGKLIWENDITLRTSVTGTHKGKIIYSSDGSFCQKDFETTFETLLINSESYFEVIGNIFDNKELLESEENNETD